MKAKISILVLLDKKSEDSNHQFLIQKFKVHLNNNDTVKEQGKQWTKLIFTGKKDLRN